MVDSNQFEYTKKSQYHGYTYWECRSKYSSKCLVTAVTTTTEDGLFIKSVKGEHEHGNNLIKKRVKGIENEHVQNAARNPTLTCRTVLKDLCDTIQQNESTRTDRQSARRNMLKMALEKYDRMAIKEFMYGLREEV